MVARPRLVAPLVTLLTACSSAPSNPPQQPPTTSPPPTASVAVSDPGSGWTPVDPRIVRCGIDDRPRNVVGSLPAREPQALLAEMAAPPPNAGARAPMPMPRRPPFVPPITPPPSFTNMPDPGPSDDLRIVPQPLVSRSGTPVPASLSSVDPHYEVCASLAQDSEPLGTVTFGLELASSGAPLRVLPPAGSGNPTPLVRCLMERACQLQATASPPGQKTELSVPLQLQRAQAVSQPPGDGPAAADIRIDVASVTPRPDRSELQLQLRSAATSAMRTCGAVPDRARVRLSLDLLELSVRRPRRRRVAPMPTGLRVTGQRTEALEGSVPNAILGCVVSAIGMRSFPTVSASVTKVSEQLLLTWNP